MNWNELDIDVDGVDIHVHRGGVSGAPAVVFAHGFSDDGRCWSRFAELIAERFDVVAVDARNHGRSGRGPADPSILAADLASVIRELGLSRPILVGHSIGATTVTVLAATFPELVGSVVLEDPPWRPDRSSVDRARLDGARAWIDSLAGRSDDDLRRLGREQHPTWPEEEFDSWAPAKHGLGPRAIEHLAPIEWEALVSSIEVPILVVLGDPELDAIATPELAAQISARNERVTVGSVADAGHNIRRENLVGFADVVVPFLDANSSPAA
ncbi:MAG: alpha/beta hydrolase [Ilumatobacteraceae bacterium]|nr:alpha/beta hydrolase [Ilumatobacteraceae bacterium]